MIFIRPRILRDPVDAAIETNAKYNFFRKMQLERHDGRVPLMPSEHQPTLPPLENLVPRELLDPALQVPESATPAERKEAAEVAPRPPNIETAPEGVAPPPPALPPPTTPFGTAEPATTPESSTLP
jgi:hypothetical protein